MNFKDTFRDQIERIVQSSDFKFPTLTQLSSYYLGKSAAICLEDELEDFYDEIPNHCRRFVLLGHVIEVILRETPLTGLIPSIAEILVNLGFHIGAFRLICDFWNKQNTFRPADYKWAMKRMKEMNRIQNWIKFLAVHMINRSKSRRSFQLVGSNDFTLSILHEVFTIYTCPNQEVSYQGLNEAVMFLITHSIETHDSGQEDSCKCTSTFKLLFNSRFQLLSKLDNEQMFSVCIWGIISENTNTKTKLFLASTMQKLIQKIEYLEAVQALDWKVPNIFKCGKLTAELGFPETALNLFVCLANCIRADAHLQEEISDIDRENIETEIKKLQNSFKPQKSWRYEPLIDSWITDTPLNRDKKVNFDDIDEIDESNLDTPLPNRYSTIIVEDPLTAPSTVEREKRTLLERTMQESTPIKDTPKPRKIAEYNLSSTPIRYIMPKKKLVPSKRKSVRFSDSSYSECGFSSAKNNQVVASDDSYFDSDAFNSKIQFPAGVGNSPSSNISVTEDEHSDNLYISIDEFEVEIDELLL